MSKPFDALTARLAEIADLNSATAVLAWDQETYMPHGAANSRSFQLSTLSKLSHELFTAPATAKLLKQAAAEPNVAKSKVKAAILRVAQTDYTKAKKLPTEFVAEVARTTSQAQHAWVDARKNKDFAAFAPWLKKNVALAQRTADYLGWQDHPYDALLNEYEPGMKTREVRAIFADLREQTVPLVRAIAANASKVSDAPIHGKFDKRAQEEFAMRAAKQIGYDMARGRLDYTAHPFCTSFAIDDVRITSRSDESFFNPMFFGVLHETGHAMYEQGVDHIYARTPVASGTSLGIHESQSRMWENLVGRSREFWQFHYPLLQQTLPHFKKVSPENFYKAINKVSPSLIRVEADEVTYNMHIMVRLEMELAMIEGKLNIKDVPEAWNAKYTEYLGVTPSNDAEGCLQDIHWSGGGIGYFSTYSLGNLYSVQLFDAAEQAIPDLRQQFARGEYGALLGWLRKNVHQYGRALLPNELIKKATGKPLSAAPYVAYLRRKFGDIYGLK
jgi:carboxypeptidase Taq